MSQIRDFAFILLGIVIHKLTGIITIFFYFPRYHRLNNVVEFSFNRPFHRGDRDPKNEFKVKLLNTFY